MKSADGGILLVDKSEGETSHDVVQKVRRVLGIRKVGHAGTLDPFATGLLVVLVGQSTKLSPFVTAETKVYEAVVHLGVETDTYDKTGKIVRERGLSEIKRGDVEKVLTKFTGEIEQIPPPFSALKIKGKRAYEMARKGEEVKLSPRKVVIYDLTVEEFEPPLLSITLRCSSGTYVRSLASDVGDALGCGAHLNLLRRTQVGAFRVEEAISSSLLKGIGSNDLKARLINPVKALPHMMNVEVNDHLARRIRKGYCPKITELMLQSGSFDEMGSLIKLVCDGQLVAIASVRRSAPEKCTKLVSLKRVFL